MSNESATRPDRVALAFLAAALAIGFLLRVEYLRELILAPFGRNLLLDAEWYDQMARHLLDGQGAAEGDAFFRPPFYPAFLTALYAIFGHGFTAPRVVQMVIGLASVWMAWRIALRTHGATVAAVAGLLAASYGMFIYFEGEILTASVGLFLTTAATLLMLEGDERSSLVMFGAAGLALGLATITHATALLLLPVALVWAIRARPGILAALVLLAGAALPIGAVTARNAAVSGEIVPVATQGGINFYIGNNELSDGKSALAPGFAEATQVIPDDDVYRDTMAVAAQTLAERDLGRSLSAAQVSRYWFARGGEWIRDHPKDAIAHFVRKAIFFWNGYEISNNRDLRDQARRFTPILRVFLVQYAFLLPLAIFGLVKSAPRTRGQSLLIGFVAVHSITIIAFFVCARFRQPAVMWLIPFAGAGAVALWNDLRALRTSPRRFGVSGLTVCLLFAGTNPTLVTRAGFADVLSDADAPFHRYNLAVLFEREGNLDRAIREYQAAARTGVPDPRIHLNLGNLLARTGRAEEAREQYRVVMRIAPDYEAAVRSNLGVLAARSGDWPESIRQFEACLDAAPTHPNALTGLAAAYLSAGRFDDAILAYRRALATGAGPEGALRRNLAVAYVEAGLTEDAGREAASALEIDSTDLVSILTLGKVALRRGDVKEAERMWARAREIAPSVPAVERAIREAQIAYGADE